MSTVLANAVTAVTTDSNLTLSAAGTGGVRLGTGFGAFQQTVYDLGTR